MAGLVAAVLPIRNGHVDSAVELGATLLAAMLIARQIVVLLDNRRLMASISHQAFHDALTGLANRALFADRLSHALELHRRDLRPVTVLLIDLDDFKTVNDSLGHPAGDELLIRVSERLRAVVRAGDTVARLGGDEFAVLMEDGGDPVQLAGRILASLEHAVSLGQRSVPVGASIGVATLHPEDAAASSADMLKRADLAMYAAKRSGKSTMCLYSSDMEHTASGELDLRAALAAAVNGEQIDVAFQPILLADGSLGGFEALARWNYDGAPVPPGVFLPIASRLGLSARLDELVLCKAAREATSWGGCLVLSVNLDGQTLSETGFADRVLDVLSETGLSPQRLAVEVLESSLIEYDEPALDTLRRLRSEGVRVVVDDFGAGYASLVRLQALEPDVVKIDRSLVAVDAPPDQSTALLTGVAQLAHQMGAMVVAEGVETESQLSAAIAAGCDAVQGFLLGRPTTARLCREIVTRDRTAERPGTTTHAWVPRQAPAER
ncbi:MAG: EAL domain-containing protein [Frankiales bacterium]|nr:EAL domain-containing protein [Frankiales bacterium]